MYTSGKMDVQSNIYMGSTIYIYISQWVNFYISWTFYSRIISVTTARLLNYSLPDLSVCLYSNLNVDQNSSVTVLDNSTKRKKKYIYI